MAYDPGMCINAANVVSSTLGRGDGRSGVVPDPPRRSLGPLGRKTYRAIVRPSSLPVGLRSARHLKLAVLSYGGILEAGAGAHIRATAGCLAPEL